MITWHQRPQNRGDVVHHLPPGWYPMDRIYTTQTYNIFISLHGTTCPVALSWTDNHRCSGISCYYHMGSGSDHAVVYRLTMIRVYNVHLYIWVGMKHYRLHWILKNVTVRAPCRRHGRTVSFFKMGILDCFITQSVTQQWVAKILY